MLRVSIILAAALGLTFSFQLSAQSPGPSAAEKNDYSDGKTWLCRPGQQDSCTVDLTTTVVSADGKLKKEVWKNDPQAQIDCFYIYPTVSLDSTPTSDMNPGPEEHNVVRSQFARFGSQCRTFAPLYRQMTLAGLRKAFSSSAATTDLALGYNDIVDAWNYYLQHDNQGRGFVLIGHSQGSAVLTQLIKNEIDGKPIQKQLLSAMLLGALVEVPKDKDVGGTFKQIPLCRKETQLGCVIVYASYRSDAPPPSHGSGMFKGASEGMAQACTNPANLGGGSGELHSYLSSRTPAGAPFEWAKGATVVTPFVSVPGLLTAQCAQKDQYSYLEITVHGDPKDPRTDNIPGDIVANSIVQKELGLHLIDANLAMGNLVDIVRVEGKAFLKQQAK